MYQASLRGLSYFLHILPLHVSKMNRTFQWASKDARPDLISLKDVWPDSWGIYFEIQSSQPQLKLYLLFIHF